MWETKEVTLTLCLPHDIADQAEELHAAEPEFLERVVMYGITRRQVYQGLRERKAEELGHPHGGAWDRAGR